MSRSVCILWSNFCSDFLIILISKGSPRMLNDGTLIKWYQFYGSNEGWSEALLDLFHSLCTVKYLQSREKLFQEVNKLMEIKYATKKVYLFHMTLIVIDSIRYNLFFSYSVSAVVFIKSIEIYFPLCAVESSPRLYGEMGDHG